MARREIRWICRTLGLLLALVAIQADAKKMYRYRDAQGQWHFRDTAPETGSAKDWEVAPVDVEPTQAVLLESRDDNGQRWIVASNRLAGPVEIEIVPQESTHVVTEPALPCRIVLAAFSRLQPIVAMRLDASQASGSIRYSYRYTPGDPAAQLRQDFAYLPPFAPHDSHPVSQGFFGEYSHRSEENRYAVDVAMPEGTPVHAARAGVVLAMENDYYESGVREKLQSRANYIRILHDDGGMAVYAHLALESALVRVGDRVAAGQPIGRSGSTGYTNGPHLHFTVQRNAGMKLVAVPFKFATPDGGAREPRQGESLPGVAAQCC